MSKVNAHRLKGKTALVTGSTAGIGLAIARRLAQEGASVIVSSRKKNNVDEAVSALKKDGLNVHGMVCHVGSADARKALVEETIRRFKKIDILVSNVACNPVYGTMLSVTDEKAWDKVFDLNVKSAFLLVRDLAPYINTNGSIVFIASYAAYNPNNFLGAYSVSKTALLGLTKVLAKELAERSIRVNCLAPGVIETSFSEALWKQNEQVSSALKNEVPLRRFGQAEECAGPVAFLVSDDASYITGETLAVTGGISCHL